MCDTLATIILDHWQNLKPRALVAYAAIVKLSIDGICTATQKELASTVGTSTRSIKRSVSDLKTLGIIQVEPFHDTTTQKTQNTYLLSRPMGQHVGPSPQTDGPEIRPMGQHVGPHVLTINTTTINNEENQLTLIENQNAQNLGALDISAQSHLSALGINPNLTQKFPNSPKICRDHTPAEILMFYDDTGKIADTLSAWRASWGAGIDVTQGGKYNPALMWVKIVEEALSIVREEPERLEPKPEKEFSPHQELFLAIGDVCEFNLKVIDERKIKVIQAIAKKLYKAGITPDQITEFGQWWYANDWRGRDKGQPPTLTNLQDEWGRFEVTKGQTTDEQTRTNSSEQRPNGQTQGRRARAGTKTSSRYSNNSGRAPYEELAFERAYHEVNSPIDWES